MREPGILEQILVKYKLTSPVSFFNKRKILRSKRRTLVKILKIEKIDSVFLSGAVYFRDLFGGFGIRLGLAGGARVFAAAAIFSLFVIVSSSLAVVYNYERMSRFIVVLTGVSESRKAYILGADEKVRIVRDDKELPSVKAKDGLAAGDVIDTSAGGTIVFQMEKKTLVRMMPKSAGTVDIDLKANSVFLRIGAVLCNVQELTDDEIFSVVTPNAMAVVAGTQFSVTYESGRTAVTVIHGAVRVTNLKTGEAALVGKEKTAKIAGDEIEMGDAGETEKILLKRFGRLEYMDQVLNKSDTVMEKFWEGVQTLDKKSGAEIEEDAAIDALEGIKKKYGKLEEIELYNGKRYKGVVISRGKLFSIMTPGGVKKIQSRNVKNVRILE